MNFLCLSVTGGIRQDPRTCYQPWSPVLLRTLAQNYPESIWGLLLYTVHVRKHITEVSDREPTLPDSSIQRRRLERWIEMGHLLER
jgi:hypothetical protein